MGLLALHLQSAAAHFVKAKSDKYPRASFLFNVSLLLPLRKSIITLFNYSMTLHQLRIPTRIVFTLFKHVANP